MRVSILGILGQFSESVHELFVVKSCMETSYENTHSAQATQSSTMDQVHGSMNYAKT